MQDLTLGVVGTCRKADERRLPIHPAHIERIDPGLRSRMFSEHGYGESFGATDGRLSEHVAGMRSREQLMAECDVVLLGKPVLRDLMELPAGKVLWGWPHCVQDEALTQVAIDRGLTLIAWEAMNRWTEEGDLSLHVFHRNNELAGYCSVMHTLQLIGTTGAYGRRLRAAVISFGATARGAVTALFALGVHEVDVQHTAMSRTWLHRSPRHGRSITNGIPTSVTARSRSVVAAADRLPRSLPTTTWSSTAFCRTPTTRSCSRPTRSWSCLPPAPWSLTSHAMRGWGSSGLGQPQSLTQCSPSGTTSAITRSTTARPIYGTPPRGRSAKR